MTCERRESCRSRKCGEVQYNDSNFLRALRSAMYGRKIVAGFSGFNIFTELCRVMYGTLDIARTKCALHVDFCFLPYCRISVIGLREVVSDDLQKPTSATSGLITRAPLQTGTCIQFSA